MRAFVSFFGLIVAALLVAAVAAYPAWLLLSPHFDFPFHRIATRIAMLALLIGFILVARRMRLADRASLGYALPRKTFLRELAIALGIGVATMLPVVLAMFALDLRHPKPGLTIDVGLLAGLAVEGLLRGLVVSLIEETFLRGAMFTGIARESGARTAIILTALVYAATHFIGRFKIAPELVDSGSGFDMLSTTLHAFTSPLVIADAFLCLAGVGVLLGVVRHLTRSIAACIGLHAGWVWVITFVRETSRRDDSAEWAMLVSQFDGVVGWLVLAWLVVIGFGLYWFYARRRSAPVAY